MNLLAFFLTLARAGFFCNPITVRRAIGDVVSTPVVCVCVLEGAVRLLEAQTHVSPIIMEERVPFRPDLAGYRPRCVVVTGRFPRLGVF